MVRHLTLVVLVCAIVPARSQDQVPPIGKGLLRASATISGGSLIHYRRPVPWRSTYLSGKLEYFVEDRVSFRGELFKYIDTDLPSDLMEDNSIVAFGPFWNWEFGRLNLAAGMEAGLSFAKPREQTGEAQVRLLPNVAACVGITYTVWNWFNFFVDARYMRARYVGTSTNFKLDEAIIGGGLGLQLPAERRPR